MLDVRCYIDSTDAIWEIELGSKLFGFPRLKQGAGIRL